MNLLVIGGTGILSTAVVNEAVNQGIKVTMINRGKRKNFINAQAELIVGDLRNNTNAILEKIKNRHFDAVIDFLVWTKEQLSESLSLFANIADQYIFISSAQVYNTSINGMLTEESSKPQPLWSYSVNKYNAELFLKDYCGRNNINYTIIRPGVNYGATRIPYGIFPAIGKHWTLVERIKNDKYIPIWNGGKNKLNLTRVEDFALGTVGLIGNYDAYNEDFNVVGDFVYSWIEVLETLGKILSCKVNTIDLPVEYYASCLESDEREGFVGGRSLDLVCSNEKLKSVVKNFKTTYDLESGLRMTLKAYEANSYFAGFDYSYEGKTDRVINRYKFKDNVPTQRFINYGIGKNNYIKYLLAYYNDSFICKFLSRIKKLYTSI